MAKRKTTKKAQSAGRKTSSSNRASAKRAPAAKRSSGSNNRPTGLTKAPKKGSSARRPVVEKISSEVPSGRRGDKNGSVPKSRLSAADLREFRQLLLDKRKDLVGDMAHLHSEAFRRGASGSDGGGSHMPIHMADIGSDTWEQELTLGLMENERGLLREIDDALDRIDNKTYGICLATQKAITKARLRAKPWAKYCIEHARKLEIGRF